MDAAQLAALRNKLVREVEEAVAQVQREPTPNPFAENWCAVSTERLNEGHE